MRCGVKNLLMALFIAAAALPAQERQPPVIARSTTRLVQVSVVATRHGAPVEGLQQEDFALTDNGRPQRLSLFSVETGGGLPAEPPLPPGVFTNRLPRSVGTPSGVTIILIDFLNTKFTDRAFARNEIVRYLKSIGPDDHVGVYALGSRLQILHDFTSPARELLARLEGYRSGGELPGTRQPEGSKDPLALYLDISLDERGISRDEWGWLNSGRITRAEWEAHTEDRVHTTLRALEVIADHLARIPGRKNLIWVSSGFPPWFGLTGGRSRKRSFAEDIAQRMRAISNASLAIYPVHARGLTLPPDFMDASVPGFGMVKYEWHPHLLPMLPLNGDPMRELADGTGGRAYIDTNDLAQAIRDAIADTRLSYTLGYYPDGDESGGEFHAISIRVNQPGVELRHRTGYFNLPPQPQDEKARKAVLQEMVSSPLDATEIGIRAELNPVPGHPDQLECVLHIDPVSLQPQGDRWIAALDVLFVEKDAGGRPFQGRTDELRLRLSPENYQRVAREGLVYRQIIESQSGATELRIVVRDAVSGAMGSVSALLSRIHRS
jgi:VWFA-related protein